MNLLLDTQIFLWVLSDPGRLTRKMHRAITAPDHSVFVSSVSALIAQARAENLQLVTADQKFRLYEVVLF